MTSPRRWAWAAFALVLLIAACSDDTAFSNTPGTSTDADGSGSTSTMTTPSTVTTEPTTTTLGTIPSITCSAVGMPAVNEPELVESAHATREAIIAAAITCDYQALATLAGYEYFAWDLGTGGSPAEYWQTQEEQHTGTPLRFLVETLNLPSAVVEAEGYVSTVWPAAFAALSWDDVAADEQAALIGLYGPDISQDWTQYGGFVHYRVAVGEEGDWILFKTGPDAAQQQ
jgi:hypothetical protein